MKLISMTDFVLDIQNWINDKNKQDDSLFANRCVKYAHFLQRPLKLEMFIPCDKDGNVLEEPTMEKYGWYSANHQEEQSGWMYEEGESEYNKAISKYRKAKSKVLFEGFEVINAEWCDENIIKLTDNKNFFIDYHLRQDIFCNNVGDWLETCSIEDLFIIANESLDTITLTQNAIKQLGL